ncbi:hypothetical protein, partial [Pseudomonas aeruginosa]|uniref:hypothetical protein n=1 Tax=Pseudomonas aeruginosa TaxID=287 RepID=UPI0020237830
RAAAPSGAALCDSPLLATARRRCYFPLGRRAEGRFLAGHGFDLPVGAATRTSATPFHPCRPGTGVPVAAQATGAA